MTRDGKSSGAKRGAAITALAAAAISLISAAKPVSLDETAFLAVARQILRDPAHPMSFTLNWLGSAAPGWATFIHSVVASYTFAVALWATVGSIALTRVLLAPVDIAAAVALFAIATRYLQRPLVPTLIVLASPTWILTVPPLTAEKWMLALGLGSLWLLHQAVEERDDWKFAASAALLAAGTIVKFTGACLAAPALGLLISRRVSPRRIAAFLLIAGLPTIIDALWLEPWRLAVTTALSEDVSRFAALPGLSAHRLRATAAFPAGCVGFAALWPFTFAAPPRRAVAAVAFIAAGVILFSPAFDVAGMSPILFDRVLGLVFFSCLAAIAFRLAESRGRALPGWPLWTTWIAAGLLTAWANLFVSGRAMLLIAPPLILAGAERMERELPLARLKAPISSMLAATFLLSLALGTVDWRWADAQRASAIDARAQGTRWFSGHWGFQYYMEAQGLRCLDEGAAGWGAVHPGERVIFARNNALQNAPPLDMPIRASSVKVHDPIPLRLISLGREAGWVASSFGFLPYVVSVAPLEVFTTVTRY